MTVQTLADAKARAKEIRAALAAQGRQISHAQALELVARQNGARDWNTFHARLAQAEPEPFQLNDKVQGRYLGQPFVARIVALSKTGRNYSVSLQLDDPVDTVQFESFSNMRRHVRGTVGPDGRSQRTTSDWTPHLILDLTVRTPSP